MIEFIDGFDLIILLLIADDDSDSNPHDFDNVNLEYGLSSHLNIGQHSFSQMQVSLTFDLINFKEKKKIQFIQIENCDTFLNQGDLDRQRLLGNRQRIGIYESNHEDGDNDGFENQERYDLHSLFRGRKKIIIRRLVLNH